MQEKIWDIYVPYGVPGLSWHPVYVVKFDSTVTVAKTGTTQIIRRGHIHLQNNHIKCALHIVSNT